MHTLLNSVPPTLQQAVANPCLQQWLLDTHRQVWVVSYGVTAPFSWVWGFVCTLQESVSPVLCKFSWLYSGVNGDLLQEGLCHTQVCCTQGPCGWPLLTCTSIGDVHTLKGRSCSVSVESPGAHKVLFVSSEHLWWVWGLILNMIFPLLPSCFSFALGCGIYFFLVGSNILLLMVVQQWVVILEFLQEKMSTCPSTPPSCF